MPLPWQVIAFPIFAAMAYALAATLLKRVSRSNVDPWRITVLTNLVAALVSQTFWLMQDNGRPLDWSLPAQALAPAMLFATAQMLTVLAIHAGDVSVATPLMGAKVLFVALLTVMVLGEPLGWRLWVAAALATVAVALLRGRGGKHHHHVGRTIAFALAASFLFALTDVIVQRYGPAWGAARFVPTMFGMVGLATLPLMLLFEKTRPGLLEGSRGFLAVASLFYAVQVMLMAFALSQYGHAATVNVVYSSRGIWGVVLAWTLGPLVGLNEHSLGRRVFMQRMAAAMLIILAIVLALTQGTAADIPIAETTQLGVNQLRTPETLVPGVD
jgi:drug/metabolite transporter (DMT)-like permease